jgi:hypothetical protein
MESFKTIKRKGITYQIDKETSESEEDYIFYITQIEDITDEEFLNRWLEYQTKDEIEDTIYYINDGYYDYIPKIISDIKKLKEKYEEQPEDFEKIVKYILD